MFCVFWASLVQDLQIEDLQESFAGFDKNSDGTITIREFCTFILSLDPEVNMKSTIRCCESNELTRAQVEEEFSTADRNK